MKEIEKMLKREWYDANYDQELLVMVRQFGAVDLVR